MMFINVHIFTVHACSCPSLSFYHKPVVASANHVSQYHSAKVWLECSCVITQTVGRLSVMSDRMLLMVTSAVVCIAHLLMINWGKSLNNFLFHDMISN